MLPQISRAGEWFLHSGIQEANGGVARYHRVDLGRNAAVSTEITGYTASVLVYLHSLTHDARYLDRATAAARFLSCKAWDRAAHVMPFEIDPPAFSYFFDCGIVVRGLLAVWRATGTEEFLDCAAAVGGSMARDFADSDLGFHPILALPAKEPVEREGTRWSHSPGCYQLKSMMAWHDLAEAGVPQFAGLYREAVERALDGYADFLPGHHDQQRVMDRLHAFLYFLEGLLPCPSDPRCGAALADGIGRTAGYLREIAPQFARSDVYAQLLRIRLFADALGAVPLDRGSAQQEAATLATFQKENGCFSFGRRSGALLPYDNPVSTAFAVQAMALWHACAPPLRHLLV